MSNKFENKEDSFINPFDKYHKLLNGQFFIQESGGISGEYEIYHWTRYFVKRKDGSFLYPYFIIVEPEELTFYRYKYDEDHHAMLKESLLVIPLLDIQSFSFKIENELRDLFQYEDKDFAIDHSSKANVFIDSSKKIFSRAFIDNSSGYSKIRHSNLFRIFFLDFLWDINVNGYFDNNGKKYIIKQALSRFPVIEAISLKLEFFEYVLGYSPYEIEAKRDQFKDITSKVDNYIKSLSRKEQSSYEEGSYSFNSELSEKQKIAFANWVSFLTHEPNEKLFIDNRLDPFVDHWLNTSEEELTKALDAGQKRKIKHKHQNLLNRRVSKYLLKRYNFLGVIRYFSPFGSIGKWLYFAFILVLFLWIIADWICFNVCGQDYNISKVLPWLILMFITMPVIAFSILGVFSITTNIRGNYKRKNRKYSVYDIEDSKIVSILNRMTVLIPQIFLPRMVLAVFSGWLLFFTSEELIKVDFDISWYSSLIILIFVFITSFVFMYNEVRNNAISLFRKNVFARITIITMLGFIISYTIGYFLMPIGARKMMEDSSVVHQYYLDNGKQDRIDSARMEITKIRNITYHIKNLDNVLSSFNSYFSFASSSKSYSTHTTGKLGNSNYLFVHASLSENINFSSIANSVVTETKNRDSLLRNFDAKIKDSIIKMYIRKNIFVYYDSSIANIETSSEILCVKDRAAFINKQKENVESEKEGNIYNILMLLDRNFEITRGIVATKLNKFSLVKDSLSIEMNRLMDPITLQEEFLKDTNHCYNHPLFEFIELTNDAEINSVISDNGKGNPLRVFPNMLMFRAIMAFFIGIFLQLIIQDKSIMEPV